MVLEPKFTYHGFRYVEISGISSDISININAQTIGILSRIHSTFKTDNNLVNRIQKNIVRGQVGNFISVPTDCPQRDERLGWMGDAQLFAPTAMYNGDMAAFYTKWMRDVRDAQSKGGGYSNVSPRYAKNCISIH